MTKLTIIVAFDSKGGIGINNSLPWRLSEDLVRFKRITTGHAIIMGRKTFESIGRPLPQRRNIVLTRNTEWQHQGAEVVNSLQAALHLIDNTDAFIIGGADIYAQALPLCSQLLVTEIHQDVACDTFFPHIDPAHWREKERTTYYSEQNKFNYAFVTYQKIHSLS
ncbi:MAG: dihydrofolate reductase [Solimicrobium sp.]|jgi:dihydrofolate reductase|nr:dihydrofolate reductase [Solimicrobium sp.]